MTEWTDEYVVVVAIAGVCILYMIIKLIIRHAYRSLLRATKDMGHSKHRLIKMMCKKFDACYQLRTGVPNVALFVEKHLRHYRVMGLHLMTWENVGNLFIVLVMASSVGSGIWAMIQERPVTTVFVLLLAGAVGTGILALTDFVWSTTNLWNLLLIDIADYFENSCKPRMENETFHPVEVDKYQRPSSKVVNLKPEPAKSTELKGIVFTPEEEDVIREVIQQYLG